MRLTYESIGDKELRAALKKYAKKKPIAVKRETYAHGLDIQRKAKENLKDMKTWDTGHLANTILLDLLKAGFVAQIEATAPYAIYVAKGTRPHFPPPDALEEWARRHGFDSAWPICKAIAKRGLPERPFLVPAYMDIKGKYYRALKKLLEK